MDQRREPCHVLGSGLFASLPERTERLIHVQRLPKHRSVEHETEGAELALLSLPVSFADLTAPSKTDPPGNIPALLASVELSQNAASVVRVIDIVQLVEGSHDASKLSDSAGQRRWPLHPQESTNQFGRCDRTELERAHDPKDILPVAGNELGVRRLSGQAIQGTVISLRVDAPKSRFAHIGQPGAEAVSKRPKQSEHNIAGASGVGHDLPGVEVRFLPQQDL